MTLTDPFSSKSARRGLSILAGAATFALVSPAQGADELPSPEEMWRIIQLQQSQIAELTARLDANEVETTSTQQALQVTDQKIEATSAFVEEIQGSGGDAADSWYRQTSLGGYGEMHATFGGGSDMIDFHRWVLFLGHQFNDRIRLFSEVELEHSIAGEGKNGEIELEQAFVEFDVGEYSSAKAGLFLLPVGILNETHEPATFYGVERNRVESEIIPTTWWEGGAAFTQNSAGGFGFDFALHSGLNVPTSGSNAFRIRSGRQKVSEASASDGAVTARVKYTGISGLELAFSGQYQSDITQGSFSESVDATLLSAHFIWNRGPFALRGLYARWDLGGNAPAVIGKDQQYGFYLEPSYSLSTDVGAFGVFARYSRYDTAAGDAVSSARSFFDVGLNYWPIENVVLKGDVQFTNEPDSANNEEYLNLGVGYQF